MFDGEYLEHGGVDNIFWLHICVPICGWQTCGYVLFDRHASFLAVKLLLQFHHTD